MYKGLLVGGDPDLQDKQLLFRTLDSVIERGNKALHIVYIGNTGALAREYAEENNLRYLLYTPDDIFKNMAGTVNNAMAAEMSCLAVLVRPNKLIHIAFFNDLVRNCQIRNLEIVEIKEKK